MSTTIKLTGGPNNGQSISVLDRTFEAGFLMVYGYGVPARKGRYVRRTANVWAWDGWLDE